MLSYIPGEITPKFNYPNAIVSPIDYVSAVLSDSESELVNSKKHPCFAPISRKIAKGLPYELIKMAVPSAYVPSEAMSSFPVDSMSMTSRIDKSILGSFDYVGLVYESLRQATDYEFDFILGQLSGMFLVLIEYSGRSEAKLRSLFPNMKRSLGGDNKTIPYCVELKFDGTTVDTSEVGDVKRKPKRQSSSMFTGQSYAVLIPNGDPSSGGVVTSTYGYPTKRVLTEVAGKLTRPVIASTAMRSLVDGDLSMMLVPLPLVPLYSDEHYEMIYSEVDAYSMIPFSFSQKCLNPAIDKSDISSRVKATKDYSIEYGSCAFTDIWADSPQFSLYNKERMGREYFIRTSITKSGMVVSYIPSLYTYLSPDMFHKPVEAWQSPEVDLPPAIEVVAAEIEKPRETVTPSHEVGAKTETSVPTPTPPPVVAEQPVPTITEQEVRVNPSETIAANMAAEAGSGLIEKEQKAATDSEELPSNL
jgi:hypothetical protein